MIARAGLLLKDEGTAHRKPEMQNELRLNPRNIFAGAGFNFGIGVSRRGGSACPTEFL